MTTLSLGSAWYLPFYRRMAMVLVALVFFSSEISVDSTDTGLIETDHAKSASLGWSPQSTMTCQENTLLNCFIMP